MHRAIIGSIVAVLILAGMSAVAQAPTRSETPQSPELKVLSRLVGSWRLEAVERQPNGDEKITTGTSIGKWSLQGKYLEIRIAGSDRKEAILHFFTYDSSARVYNMWSFVPNSPRPTLNTWQWDESEKTLTGKGDLGNGITMQSTTQFISEDRMEYIATTKDASGNVLVEMKGEMFRKR